MKFKVVLYESEEGIAVGCPSLPGCWSQGETKEEAFENIQIGIREFLEVIWDNLKEEIAKDLAEDESLSIDISEVEVDITGIESVENVEAKV